MQESFPGDSIQFSIEDFRGIDAESRQLIEDSLGGAQVQI